MPGRGICKLERVALFAACFAALVPTLSVASNNNIDKGNSIDDSRVLFAPKISPDLSAWNDEAASLAKHVGVQRLWSRSHLQAAASTQAPGHFQHMGPLLDKLNSGQAVTVVALGDSIVRTFGGCFGATCDPSNLPGWLSSFMHSLNATWPHRDHLLVNAGLSAHSFHAFAYGVCIETLIPTSVDLVIMEHLPHKEVTSASKSGKHARQTSYVDESYTSLSTEVLLYRIQMHLKKGSRRSSRESNINSDSTSVSNKEKASSSSGTSSKKIDESSGGLSMPPLVFLNMIRAFNLDGELGAKRLACMRSHGVECEAKCAGLFEGLPLDGDESLAGETGANLVAERYGMVSMSFTKLVRSIVQQPQQVGQMVADEAGITGGQQPVGSGMSVCHKYAAILKDAFHPYLGGNLLLADLLMDYLAGAEEAHYMAAGGGNRQASEQPGAVAGKAMATRKTQFHAVSTGLTRTLSLSVHTRAATSSRSPVSLLMPGLHGGLRLPVIRCFDTVVLPAYGPKALWPPPPRMMAVVGSGGWDLIAVENNRFRPGWVSTTPGSKLRISLDIGAAARATTALSSSHGSADDTRGSSSGSGDTLGRVEDGGSSSSGSGDTLGRVEDGGNNSSGSGDTLGRVEDGGNNSSASGDTLDGSSYQGDMMIEVSMLTSYERMGVAEVSCVEGCQCEPVRCDCHTSRRDSTTELCGIKITSFDAVSAKSRCVVQVLVLPSTSSGQHKVKVSQVAIKTWMKVSGSGAP